MDILDIMRKRHSVRSFRSLEIGSAAADILDGYIDGINKKYGVSLRLVTGEPKAFGGLISKIGTFKNVHSYFVVAAPKDKEFEAGYCGELALLKAAELGINSCWVGMTYSKLCSCRGEPQWFMRGMEGAMLAPTAMNRQKFFFRWDGRQVTAQAGAGVGTVLDLGIAVCHFELASGHKVVRA